MQLAAWLVAVSIFALPQSFHAQSVAESRTPASVISADKAWGLAEEKGDAAFVDALLLPEYRSISPDGSVHDKAAILANTREATPQRASKIEKYLSEHPTDMAVSINGDIAVLIFTAKGDGRKRVLSCDIFVYRDGRWRALYSQHTTAENA